MTKIPFMNKLNASDKILTFPTGVITLAELKSIQPFLTRGEKCALSKIEGFQNSANSNWLPDSVIDGFLFRLTLLENEKVIALSACVSQCMLKGKEEPNIMSNLETHQHIFIPYNVNNNHWILLDVATAMRNINGT